MINGNTRKVINDLTKEVADDLRLIRTMDDRTYAKKQGMSKQMQLQILSDSIGLMKVTMDGLLKDGVITRENYMKLTADLQAKQKDIEIEFQRRSRGGSRNKKHGKKRGRRG